VAGGTYFFTLVTYQRRRLFAEELNRRLLGNSIRTCQVDWPFSVDAIVLLPDHLHAMITLPNGDTNYSGRWSVIKKTFNETFLANGGRSRQVSEGRRKQKRLGIWQPRFWEHVIRDEDDFDAHFDYIHFNPVKHGLVECPIDWAASSFHRWVRQGVCESDWACGRKPPPDFSQIKHDFGEP